MHCLVYRRALQSTRIVTPRIPVISNVDAQPHSDPETIKDILARQVKLCTLSRKTACAYMSGGVPP